MQASMRLATTGQSQIMILYTLNASNHIPNARKRVLRARNDIWSALHTAKPTLYRKNFPLDNSTCRAPECSSMVVVSNSVLDLKMLYMACPRKGLRLRFFLGQNTLGSAMG